MDTTISPVNGRAVTWAPRELSELIAGYERSAQRLIAHLREVTDREQRCELREDLCVARVLLAMYRQLQVEALCA